MVSGVSPAALKLIGWNALQLTSVAVVGVAQDVSRSIPNSAPGGLSDVNFFESGIGVLH